MAEIKFSCPNCNQSIKCDELWGGHQIQCPSCQNNLTVPVPQSAAIAPPPAPMRAAPTQVRGSSAQVPPPASGQSRLALGRQQHGESAGASAPAKSGPVYRNYTAKKEKSGGPLKWAIIGAVVIAAGVGGYFGYGWLSEYQQKVNEKRRAVEADSDGGQVGHIANLYEVLDATENGRIEPIGRRGSTAPRAGRASDGGAMMDGDDPDDSKPRASGMATNLPLIPAVWTLDLNSAKIPEGRANGKISGTNFAVQTALLTYAGTTPVLSLRQGTGPSPDREILVYLRLKAGEELGGHTWTVTKDMKGASVPQISKRWKTNPKFAPTQKNFPTGYAMKLELGKISDGEVTGKIFVALPDPEQTVVAGIFTATASVPDSGTAAAANPAAAPTQPRPTDPAFEARYGVKR